jgi:hypothetical protein
MLISIKINNSKIELNNIMTKNKVINIINIFEKNIIIGCDMIIFLFNINTADFDSYTFEYLKSSKNDKKKWLINNLLYSITCDETRYSMRILFINLKNILYEELKN